MSPLEIFLLFLLAAAFVSTLWYRHRWQASQRQRARELREVREERQRHEAAEQAQQARMEAILDGMIEGLLVLDPNGRIALANRAAEQMFQFSRMMVGRAVLETLRNHEVAALAARALSATQAIEHEVRLEGVSPRLLQITAVALRDANGATAGAVLVFHDVTRLRQLEAMRQDFVANVSHELRTPLSLIKSTTETLIDSGAKDPAVTARFLEIIDKHASRLTLLIDDLLLLARLDSDRMELNLQPVPLRDAAQEAVDDCSARAKTRNVSLANRVPAGVVARADPERVQQVLGNLIENAIKYGRSDGQVIIGGRVLDAERVELSVRDDGPGIPLEAQPRIFERFYRVDKARSREQGGTGLGLAIVKNVVQAHGGEVRVESAPGKGTEFFITLRAAQAER
jgi:two-component system, OmpR family, phosphate regulon sensor histidine kinase PhoR